MKLAGEAEIVQNSALGAAILWAFTVEYCGENLANAGPAIALVLPVLPMALHSETVDALNSRNYSGGLDLALAENRTLTVDLQERMEAMWPQTMECLNVAFATGLLTYNKEIGALLPARKTNPFKFEGTEVRKMMNTATRLGYWFATINLHRLGSLLRIRL